MDAITRALKFYEAGGLVAFPTDTVYGVGALAFDDKAVESIYTAKDRPIEKAIPILIGDMDDLDKIAMDIPELRTDTRVTLLARAADDARPQKADSPRSRLCHIHCRRACAQTMKLPALSCGSPGPWR